MQIRKIASELSGKKVLSDLVWNYISLAILSLSGFFYTFIIVGYYNPEVLGLFNEAYSYYLLFSQLTVFGIHAAVLKFVAQYQNDKHEQDTVLSTGLCMCVIISILVSLIILGAIHTIFPVYDDSTYAIILSLLALPFFSINKVIIAYLNGRLLMRSFAVLQAIRPLGIALSITILAVRNAPGVYLGLSFLCSELVLLCISLAYIFICQKVKITVRSAFFSELFRFGIAFMPSNLMLEFNARIDIILISLLMNDKYLLGIYSFAALFADGLYQIYVVIRRNINPNITKYYYEETEGGRRMFNLCSNVKRWTMLAALPLATALCLGFYGICIIFSKVEYLEAFICLIILSIAITVNGGSIVLGNLLSQTGYPSKESKVNIIATLLHIVLGLILVPLVSIYGAALSSAASYTVYAVVQKKYALRYAKITI